MGLGFDIFTEISEGLSCWNISLNCGLSISWFSTNLSQNAGEVDCPETKRDLIHISMLHELVTANINSTYIHQTFKVKPKND